MAACPYSARYFNWQIPEDSTEDHSKEHWEFQHVLGTIEKCGWCGHDYEKGILPPCVRGCPHGAIFFGDLNEDTISNGRETWRISEVFKKRQPFRLFEELGTEPRVYYLPRFRTPKLQPPLSERGAH
jgi:molybdopterin-containing oxidoreductase family iron-sulfur binding subunit